MGEGTDESAQSRFRPLSGRRAHIQRRTRRHPNEQSMKANRKTQLEDRPVGE